jgi:Tfp pilus assembly protein PilF
MIHRVPVLDRATGRASGRGAFILSLLLAGALVAPAQAGEEKSPKYASSHLKLASTMFEAGRYPEALSTVDAALQADSKYVPAHQLRGQILFAMDEVDQALKEFSRVLDLDKTYTEARNWKGYALVQLQRFDDAMAEYNLALKDLTYQTPEKIHLNIGMLYRLQGKMEPALQSLQKAVSLNSSYARGYYELGVTYEQMGKNKEALRAYQDALVGMDQSADLHLRIGLALIQTGDKVKARQHLERVRRLSPDGPLAARADEEIRRLNSSS